MTTLINPKIVINLEKLLYETTAHTVLGDSCSFHKALRIYCMNLMMYNHPDPGATRPEYWKDCLYSILIAIPELDIKPLKADNYLKMDLLLELCIQYIFDCSAIRTIPESYPLIAWDEVHLDWTRNFEVQPT